MTIGKWIGVIVFILSLYILWQLRHVILLAFTAILLATAVNQLVCRLQRVGVKRGIAVTLTIGFILSVILAFLALIVPIIGQQWRQLLERVPQGIEQLRTWYSSLQSLVPNQLLNDIKTLSDVLDQIPSTSYEWFGNFFTIFSNSLGGILKVLLVMVLTIMLVSDPKPYRQGFILLFPSFYRHRADDILSKCEQGLVGCIIGLLFNMMVITIMSGLGLWALGVKLAFVNALIAGLLTFIPNLGPTLSVIPPTILALLDAPWKASGVVILYIAIQQIESNILTPLVMKNQVSLLPAITLLSQVIFGIFFGFLGLFLAVPLVVILQVFVREILIEDVLNPWTKNKSIERSSISSQ